MDYFEKVKGYLLELDYEIVSQDSEEELFLIENEDKGIKNMIIDCEDPILVIEQYLFEVRHESQDLFRELLIKNRDIVHGAFVLDEAGKNVLFRDTLQLENLDLNELQGSLSSLSLLLTEYYNELIKFAKN